MLMKYYYKIYNKNESNYKLFMIIAPDKQQSDKIFNYFIDKSETFKNLNTEYYKCDRRKVSLENCEHWDERYTDVGGIVQEQYLFAEGGMKAIEKKREEVKKCDKQTS